MTGTTISGTEAVEPRSQLRRVARHVVTALRILLAVQSGVPA
jgi:hypothetical protein